MNARLRLVAGLLLATIAVSMTGCGIIPASGPATPAATVPAAGTASSTASATAAATTQAPAAVTQASFAAEPAPRSPDPVLKSGSWGYHSAIDWDDAGEGRQINSVAEQNERYRLIREQYRRLLSTLKRSPGVKRLVSAAGGDTSDIMYSVITLDASDEVGYLIPWVTATLRASFPTHDGLKAVDIYVYRIRTHKGLNNTPYVSGTSVGYVDTDGSIANPTHPTYPR